MDVWILSARRTPIGAFLGGLAPLTAADLGVRAAEAALAIGPGGASLAGEVDLAIFGCARQAGARPNPARQIARRAGIPVDRPAFTVNMACASGLEAVLLAARAIRAGDAEVALAGGVESMSNVPHLLMGSRKGYRLGHERIADGMYQDGFLCPLCDKLMGETADLLARELGIGRADSDAFAVESQRRCQAARREGRFDREIVPVAVAVPGGKGGTSEVAKDEHPREDVTVEKLAKLKPVFSPDGVVTAGNASGINDAGAALVLASAAWARARGFLPLARLGAAVETGVEPERMGISPVPAVRKLLDRTGRALDAYAVIELNEAFAPQALACIRQLELDPARTNPLGGAIALGHPVGCTGARLLVTLTHQLARLGAGALGIATLCVSGGLGLAVEVEAL